MRTRTAIGGAVAIALATGLSAAGTAAARSRIGAPVPPSLMVQYARSGVVRPVSGRRGSYDVVLSGVRPQVASFQQSPGLVSRPIALPRLLVALFAKGGTHNAALSAGGREMAVTLRSGRYDAKRATVSYRVTAMKGAKALPRDLRAPVLFIDSADGYTCNVQLNNYTDTTLTPTNWDDPGSQQRMTSNPGVISPSGYSTWASEGLLLAEPCSNWVTWNAVDVNGNFVATLTVSVDVPRGSNDNGYTCAVSGPQGQTVPYACALDPNADTGGDDPNFVFDLTRTTG
jgi:hypothetical protein